MNISRSKIFNYISYIILISFSVYAQYILIEESITEGVQVKYIMQDMMEVYLVIFIAVFFILTLVKISIGASKVSKQILKNSFIESIFLSVSFMGFAIMLFSKGVLLDVYMISMIMLCIIRIVLNKIDKKNYFRG